MASRFRNFVSNISDKWKPKSLIASGEKTEFYDVSTEELKRVDFKDLEKLYLNDPMVFSGINVFSHACLGRGYYVAVKNDDKQSLKGKELCEKVLAHTTFRPTFVSAIANTLIYGVGYQENVWDDGTKNITGFRLIDPKTIKTKWDKHGNITKYGQYVQGSEKAKFQPHQIVFYKFFQIADGMKGIGFVEPIKDDLEIKQDIEDSIKEMIKKFAYPQLHVIKKGETNEAELKKTSKEFKNIHRKSYFITNENMEVKAIDVARRIPDLSFYVNFIIDNIAAGLRVPIPFLLERGERVTRATAFALMEYSNFEISLIQEMLTRIIEQQVFKPLCLKNNLPIPDFKWHPLQTEREVDVKVMREKVAAISEAVKSGLMDAVEGKAMLVELMNKSDKPTLGQKRGEVNVPEGDKD